MFPDVRVGPPIPRWSETTGKPLAPAQWVWHPCRSCGELTAVPLGAKGFLSKDLGKCPLCGRRR